jgi:hypothetical protein
MLAADIAVGQSVALALLGAEVAMLVSLLVVAALVESGFSQLVPPSTISALKEKRWAQRVADLLIADVVLCFLAIAISLAYACTDACALAVATVASFVFALAPFAFGCLLVLRSLRERIGNL